MQAKFSVQKMTLNGKVYSAIETISTKTSAHQHFTEIIPETFLISTGLQIWSHENVFTREPNRMFAIVMTTSEAFLGPTRVNLFHLKNFNLNSITVYRNGYPVATTPLQTENDKKHYLISVEAPDFGQHGHP